MFVRSATGVFGSVNTASAALALGTLSPVSADSSAVRSFDSMRRASAGSLSPVLICSTSPMVMSRCDTSVTSPSRTTVTVVSSLMSFSASNALALRPSITTVIVTDRAMAKKMPTHSRMSAWPPAMARVMLTPRVMAAAIISMMSIGSAAVLTMRESIDSGFGLVKALGPYWFRLCAACSLVRP